MLKPSQRKAMTFRDLEGVVPLTLQEYEEELFMTEPAREVEIPVKNKVRRKKSWKHLKKAWEKKVIFARQSPKKGVAKRYTKYV